MSHAHLAIAHSLPPRRTAIAPWPFRVAVPLIVALSAALWAGLWQLGSLAVGLIG